MTDESITDTKLSRRQFMGTAAAGAAALGAVAGATTLMPHVASMPSAAGLKALNTAGGLKAEPVGARTNWSYSTDVVVVGYGSAGAAAAIAAFDAGADVMIVEKTPSLKSLGITNGSNDATQISGGGGNSHICGGEGGWTITDPVQGAIWLYNMSFGTTPFLTCEAWANAVAQNATWFDSIGMVYSKAAAPTTSFEVPNIPGSAGIGMYSLSIAGNGQGGFHQYDNLVQKRGIPILFSARATDLIQDPATKAILGVKAMQNLSEVVNIQAKRGVILTTGGFEFNGVMKLNYLKMAPYHFGGWQYNTGDGINMALKVGAGLWHMNSTSGRPAPWIPTHNMAWATTALTKNYIWVDRRGNRFQNETSYPGHDGWCAMTDWDPLASNYLRDPFLMIFDETLRLAGPVAVGEGGDALRTGINALPIQLGGTMDLTKPTPSGQKYASNSWSLDNTAEIAAGWIIKGADIPTLAANIASATIYGSNQNYFQQGQFPPGWDSMESMDNVTLPAGSNCPNMSAANLTAAVNQYNADCTAGKGDTVFGRTAATMAPVLTAPFYAIPLWPAGPNTNGGPIRNETAHVCDPDYNPIPRLYSAGELGSVYGFLYQGGGNLTESAAIGRVAGVNAAAEIPWTS